MVSCASADYRNGYSNQRLLEGPHFLVDAELLHGLPNPEIDPEVEPFLHRPFLGEPTGINVFDHARTENVRYGKQRGRQLSPWGEYVMGTRGHSGWDYVLTPGTEVLAAADGEISEVDRGHTCEIDGETYQNIELRMVHRVGGREWYTEYIHLDSSELEAGDQVLQGDVLGLSGSCGTTPHLHFSVRRFVTGAAANLAEFDPYGYDGPGSDPWSEESPGLEGKWLWAEGEAPPIFRGRPIAHQFYPRTPGPFIIGVRHMGWNDAEYPNNEYIEVGVGPYDTTGVKYGLKGWRLVVGRRDLYRFTDEDYVGPGSPIRVYVGKAVVAGSNARFAGLTAPILDDVNEPEIRLIADDLRVVMRLRGSSHLYLAFE